MRARAAGWRIGNEQGGATLFVMFALPVMVMLLILVIDISDLVLQRIRLQTTVDACALAAAARQATGLNEIADLNRSAEEEFRKAVANLRALTWVNAAAGRQAYNFHRRCLYWVNKYRQDANRFFAADAERYAQSVKNHTMPETNLVNELRGYHYPDNELMQPMRTDRREVQWRYYASWCKKCINVASWYTGLPDPVAMYTGVHKTYRPSVINRTMPMPGAGFFDVLWQKSSSQMTYVLYRLEQEAKPLILGNRLFDSVNYSFFNRIPRKYQQYINKFRTSLDVPKMVAYAAAKPTGGYICRGRPAYYTPYGNFKPEYEPILVQLPRVPKQVPYGYLMEH